MGDKVGVGCLVESCLECNACKNLDELGCAKNSTQTYGMPIQHGLISTDTGITYGGYSGKITVHKRFAVKVIAIFNLSCFWFFFKYDNLM